MEILPGINCADYECVAQTHERLSDFLSPEDWVHLDISDGIFTFNRTWNDPRAWHELRSRYRLEVHLMVNEPELEVEAWLEGGAERVITHYEAIQDARNRPRPTDQDVVANHVIEACRAKKAEAIISTNPETRVDGIVDFLARFDGVQVLAVDPGPSGQQFLPVALEKLKFLRAHMPSGIIEIDGGVDANVASQIKLAGADRAVSTSFIWKSKDSRKAYELLRRL